MEKKCIIEELQEFFAKRHKGEQQHLDHFVIGISVTDSGIPHGIASKMQSNPLFSLAMIDLMSIKLKETREEVLQHIEKCQVESDKIQKLFDSGDFKNFQKIFDKISENDKEFFDDIHRKFLKAMLDRNEEGMKNILQQLRDYAKKKFGKDMGGSDFNFDDFKNGF